MAMYVLTVVPLIRQLRAVIPEAFQAWFADDVTAVGSLPCSSGSNICLLMDWILDTFLMLLKLF